MDAERHDIAVVGGGPAGLAAAEALSEAGLPVTLFDRMPSLGRKLLMAGRGGLNLTHGEPLPVFLERYHPAGGLLREAVTAYPPDALREWCAGLGEPTFVGSSGRVFPKSFKASPLLRAWLARLAGRGVALRPRHRLVAIDRGSLVFATPEDRLTIRPAASILALGGASWPRLGSDGAWIPLLERAGVALAPLRPANAGFRVDWSPLFSERFSGAPLKRIGLLHGGERRIGEAVVTRNGIEGGAIYALSRGLREAIDARGEASLALDLRPDLDAADLARRLDRSRPGESLSNRLRKAAGLSPVAIGLLREGHGVRLPDAPAALADAIKCAPLRLRGTMEIVRAISTAGGVRFEGLDARFMLERLPGVFVAGEMLDWEAPTGGYLLQASIATGRAAARGALAWLGERASAGGQTCG